MHASVTVHSFTDLSLKITLILKSGVRCHEDDILFNMSLFYNNRLFSWQNHMPHGSSCMYIQMYTIYAYKC